MPGPGASRVAWRTEASTVTIAAAISSEEPGGNACGECMSTASSGRKQGLVAFIAVAGLAAALAVIWLLRLESTAPPKKPPVESPVLAPDAVSVAPGVYLLGRTAPAAAYVVDTPDGLVLIDSGLEA